MARICFVIQKCASASIPLGRRARHAAVGASEEMTEFVLKEARYATLCGSAPDGGVDPQA